MAKTKKNKRFPELDYKTGIVVYTSRNGGVYASYFDENNDFNSIFQSLLAIKSIIEECIEEDILDDELNYSTYELYDAMNTFIFGHDRGSLEIVKNLE